MWIFKALWDAIMGRDNYRELSAKVDTELFNESMEEKE